MNQLLDGYPVVVEIPVAWGDMDAFQHVNNVVYFRYFESARIVYFREIDMLEVMDRTGIGPILASTQCRFKIPLTYPDTVSVGTKVTEIQQDRFTMEHVLASQRLQKIAATGKSVLVSFDYRENKKAPIPAQVRERILTLEEETPHPIG